MVESKSCYLTPLSCWTLTSGAKTTVMILGSVNVYFSAFLGVIKCMRRIITLHCSSGSMAGDYSPDGTTMLLYINVATV